MQHTRAWMWRSHRPPQPTSCHHRHQQDLPQSHTCLVGTCKLKYSASTWHSGALLGLQCAPAPDSCVKGSVQHAWLSASQTHQDWLPYQLVIDRLQPVCLPATLLNV